MSNAEIRLSSILVTFFKLGVPTVFAITYIWGGIAYFSGERADSESVIYYVVLGGVFAIIARRSARLFGVHLSDQRIRFSAWFQDHEFAPSELEEVIVTYRRGIPWAVFRVICVDCPGVRSFHTILRPTIDYLWTGELSELSAFTGVRVTYKSLWGRERSFILGGGTVDNRTGIRK
jgi:hypothetical protein